MSKIIKEAMRIGGKHVSTDAVVNVHYPYTNDIIGTVPAGRAEHARMAEASMARGEGRGAGKGIYIAVRARACSSVSAIMTPTHPPKV